MLKHLWPLLFVSLTAFAADTFIQEDTLSPIARTSGGTEYEVMLNEPTRSLDLTLEAELVNPEDSNHKIQIHAIKTVNRAGTVATIASNVMLTGQDAKFSVAARSGQDITKVVIVAESWRASHSLYYSIEAVRTTQAPPSGPVVVTPPPVDDGEVARRQAEEEARRRAAADAAAEQARQQQCGADFPSVRLQSSRCSNSLSDLQRNSSEARRNIEMQNRRIDQLEAPITSCTQENARKKNRLDGQQNILGQKAQAFNAAKAQAVALQQQQQTAATFGVEFECVMSRVGENRRGNYTGRGPTPAHALEDAFNKCPKSSSDGCGKQDKFHGDINCRPVRQ